MSWKDKVNNKRQEIRMELERQITPNLAEVAKITKSAYSTVKNLYEEMNFFGEISEYEYNNLKTEDEVENLRKDVRTLQEGYNTVTDLKRIHPSFSRKYILRVIRSSGFRWRKVRRQPKNPLPNYYNSRNICRVISHVAQGLQNNHTEMLYVDEMKFPLVQNSNYHWAEIGVQDKVIYSQRTAENLVLTAVVLCSTRGFQAVQFFKGELSARDFYYFLNEAIQRLPLNQNYSIMLDNATWHTAVAVTTTPINDFLRFNEPRMYQINLIENAFSAIRHDFRKRPLVKTVEDEVRQIVALFFDERNERRFRGFHRNHVRMLIKYMERHRQRLMQSRN